MTSSSSTNNADDPGGGGGGGVQVVLIPDDPSKPLQLHRLRTIDPPLVDQGEVETSSTSPIVVVVRRSIESLLIDSSSTQALEGQDQHENLTTHLETPLIRPNIDKQSSGLYAYVLPQKTKTKINSDDSTTTTTTTLSSPPPSSSKYSPNVRATRLAMSCGLFSIRFVGPVVVMRCQYIPSLQFENLTLQDLRFACEVSPDLRRPQTLHQDHNKDDEDDDDLRRDSSVMIPDWLKSAAFENYHDASAVSRMAKIFTTNKNTSSSALTNRNDDDDEDDDEEDDDDDSDDNDMDDSDDNPSRQKMKEVVTKTPICLHCRRPTNNLCPGCHGAYFCPPTSLLGPTSSSSTTAASAAATRDCRKDGWSHDCLCSTWKQYTKRRTELSIFEFLGGADDDNDDHHDDWQSTLTGREFQISEQPYEDWLRNRGLVGVIDNDDDDHDGHNYDEEDLLDSRCSESSSSSSWWMTETHGWAGGQSNSARQVDARVRKSYSSGFAPLSVTDIPPQRRVTQEEWDRAEFSSSPIPINSVGLRKLSSWEQYYRVRNIPASSPIALLCTFPLTVYHAIVQYGEVPVTVAKIMKRPLKIHLVGAEKELHLLDLFQEIAFLLPKEINVEIVMIVRKDMLPPSHRQQQHEGKNGEGSLLLRVELASNLTVGIAAGSYGDPSSLDPTFDLGGPPDMVIALNAGLFAYESWRSVVEYLDHNRGVVGVFTDYNEHSGVNCASLGGIQSRNSLAMNPFRQPRAMPVYSMNLPQFSNGFFYVFNEQDVE